MKKWIALLLALGLMLGLAGCMEDTPEPEITTATEATTEETTTTTQAITVDESLPYEIVLYRSYVTNYEPFIVRETITSRTDGTAEHIVQLLVDHGVLRTDSHVLSFDGTTLDMNAGFLRRTGGSEGGAILSSLVNTFLTFFELDSMYVTAAGEVLTGHHNVYDWPLTYVCFAS